MTVLYTALIDLARARAERNAALAADEQEPTLPPVTDEQCRDMDDMMECTA